MSGNRQSSSVMTRKVFLVSESQRKLKKPEKTWKNHEKMIDTHGTVYYNKRV